MLPMTMYFPRFFLDDLERRQEQRNTDRQSARTSQGDCFYARGWMMRGRTRCNLNSDQVARACGADERAASVPTHQIDLYCPSYNVSPQAHLSMELVEGGGGGGKGDALYSIHEVGFVPSFAKNTVKPNHYKMIQLPAAENQISGKAAFSKHLQK